MTFLPAAERLYFIEKRGAKKLMPIVGWYVSEEGWTKPVTLVGIVTLASDESVVLLNCDTWSHDDLKASVADAVQT